MVSSKPRAHMPASRRAKIYAPFDALKGLKEAIAAKEIIKVPRIELTEERKAEINQILQELKKGEQITVVYYCMYEESVAAVLWDINRSSANAAYPKNTTLLLMS